MSKYESYEDYLERHLEKQQILSAKEKLLIEEAFLSGWVAHTDWFTQFDDMEKEAKERLEIVPVSDTWLYCVGLAVIVGGFVLVEWLKSI